MRGILAAVALTIAAGLSAGCARTAPSADQAAATCPDDGPRLAGTGICVGRASAYLDPEDITADLTLPEGCSWTFNETMFPDGGEALLYRAASCAGKTTQLELRGGARSAGLGYATSAVFEQIPADHEPVQLFPTEGVADPREMILQMARASTPDRAEASACAVRAADDPRFPRDALVIDASDAYKATAGIDPAEAYAVCGPFGHTTDAVTFWRIRQGYAWRYDLGQDLPDFDPASLTLMRKADDGTWSVVE